MLVVLGSHAAYQLSPCLTPHFAFVSHAANVDVSYERAKHGSTPLRTAFACANINPQSSPGPRDGTISAFSVAYIGLVSPYSPLRLVVASHGFEAALRSVRK
ncbi:hypothetical protein PC9H_009195 [Pleurotus ostreatus]|uniref:Uncharacterized protein n=1 Tax=Pleurotus ostreatus TaxID=5322 RepID=A0A8H7DTT9_PLEOS|nr:uncharacterized protein PC9H_009195 [Pleurotus ostreatus]KAF7426826.1 hypothetical protein PC9H_009195 [Pleurotus ostreatus]